MKCTAIFDTDHGPENEGWYFRFATPTGEVDEVPPTRLGLGPDSADATEDALREAADGCARYAGLGAVTEFEIHRS